MSLVYFLKIFIHKIEPEMTRKNYTMNGQKYFRDTNIQLGPPKIEH